MSYANTNKSLYDDLALWEKCHTLYYIKKGTITFDTLEKLDMMIFVKLP